jgi:hypothetical protein
MRTVLFTLCLVVLVAGVASAQSQSSPGDVVASFKAFINSGNIDGMLSLYGDFEISAPLQESNYSRLSEPMEMYAQAWRNAPFNLVKQETGAGGEVVVHVDAPSTKEYIKFYTIEYDGKWYIKDTEVYDTRLTTTVTEVE